LGETFDAVVWFVFLLTRILVAALFAALPLMVGSPPIWLVIFCAVTVVLLLLHGVLDPKYRFHRALTELILGILALRALQGAPEVTEAMIPHAALRDWANFGIDLLRPVMSFDAAWIALLGICVLVLTCLIAHESWQTHRARRHGLSLRVLPAHSCFHYDPVETGYVIETRVVVRNAGETPVTVHGAAVTVQGCGVLHTELAPCKGQVVGTLEEFGSTPMSPGVSGTFHIRADVEDRSWLTRFLRLLDAVPGRVVPLPCRVELEGAEGRFFPTPRKPPRVSGPGGASRQ